jgi:hypothetical protein
MVNTNTELRCVCTLIYASLEKTKCSLNGQAQPREIGRQKMKAIE